MFFIVMRPYIFFPDHWNWSEALILTRHLQFTTCRFPLLSLKSRSEWVQSKPHKNHWCHTECLFSAKCRVELKVSFFFLSGYWLHEGYYILSLRFTKRFGLRAWQRARDRHKLTTTCDAPIHEAESGQASFCCSGWLCHICRELDAAAATR